MPQMLLNAQGCTHLNEHAAAEHDGDEDVAVAVGEGFAAGEGETAAANTTLDDTGSTDGVLVGGEGDDDDGDADGGGEDLGEETASSDDDEGSLTSAITDGREEQVHAGEFLWLSLAGSFRCLFALLVQSLSWRKRSEDRMLGCSSPVTRGKELSGPDDFRSSVGNVWMLSCAREPPH